MKYATEIILVLIVVAMFIGILTDKIRFQGDRPPGSRDTVVVVRIDTVFGSIPPPTIIRPTVTVPPVVIPPLSLAALDSIVYDYLSARLYERTLGDTNVQVTIRDSVRGNRIVWSDSLRYSIRNRTIIQTITETPPDRREMYLGAILNLTPGTDPRVVPSLVYRDRKGRAFIAGYDPGNRAVNFGAGVRIFGKDP